MKLFLSKYYPIEKAKLPLTGLKQKLMDDKNVVPTELEVGGIVDFIPNDEKNSPFLKDLRNNLSEKSDYTADCMPKWLTAIAGRHGTWNQFGNSLAYVMLVPSQDSVAIFTQGTLNIWRVRETEEAPVSFQTNGKQRLEPTQTGDIWLILNDDADKPASKTPKNINGFVYDYMRKSFSEKSYAKNFYILNIEKQIDITQPAAIPTADKRIGEGALTIAKQLLAAGQPFSSVELLLQTLSAHEVVGTEAKGLLEKYVTDDGGSGDGGSGDGGSGDGGSGDGGSGDGGSGDGGGSGGGGGIGGGSETSANGKLRPYSMIGGAMLLGSILAYNVKDMLTPQTPREPQIVVPPKVDSSKTKPTTSKTEPTLDPPSNQTPVRIPPKPSTTTSTQPPITIPPMTPAPKLSEAQLRLNKVNDLLQKAQTNIEKYPTSISDALRELAGAGLDRDAYDKKQTEIRVLTETVVRKLRTEADALSNTAENTGKEGKAPKAVRALQAAKAKLELEKKIKASKEVEERLKKIEERIEHWDTIFGR
jgi:hypothetical protein